MLNQQQKTANSRTKKTEILHNNSFHICCKKTVFWHLQKK